MLFINKFKILFYIVIMNFIIALFLIIDDLNYLFIIINKFLKRVLFIFEKVIYSINE